LLSKSEYYRNDFELDVCLNDGSVYPSIIHCLRGDAFAWGFYNKVVMQGEIDYNKNVVILNGYKWNLTELLAHEMVHCVQFDRFGIWNSKPLADIPEWKWEGYAEYISRKLEYGSLAHNIRVYTEHSRSDEKDAWAITLPDSTIVPVSYCRYWLMVQYCMDVKKMDYNMVLQDSINENEIMTEMIEWSQYNSQHAIED
jgi:hypothetical protein